MSVPVNQRSHGKLEACVKAHDLAVYTLSANAGNCGGLFLNQNVAVFHGIRWMSPILHGVTMQAKEIRSSCYNGWMNITKDCGVI